MAFNWKAFAASFLDKQTEGIRERREEAKEFEEEQEELDIDEELDAIDLDSSE